MCSVIEIYWLMAIRFTSPLELPHCGTAVALTILESHLPSEAFASASESTFSPSLFAGLPQDRPELAPNECSAIT
jgi:hypothetical protein